MGCEYRPPTPKEKKSIRSLKEELQTHARLWGVLCLEISTSIIGGG